jgi:hypothetical protein
MKKTQFKRIVRKNEAESTKKISEKEAVSH